MSDYLVQLGQSPQARRVIKQLGLPIPLPQKLRRARGPWEDRPLADEDVVVASGPDGELTGPIADTLAEAGAHPVLLPGTSPTPFGPPGEAWGRPATLLASEAPSDDVRPHALVFDASGLDRPDQLGSLHDFFHPWVRRLGPNGRVVVLGRIPDGIRDPAKAASMRALEGFIRSLAKEIGRAGATANLVYVAYKAERRLPALLRWLLSTRSAYVTGQPFGLTRTVKTQAVPRWVRPLEGKVALVTGAARGIGKETARVLAAEGAKVVVLDRPADDGPASKTAREVGGSLLLCDVSTPEAPTTIAHHLVQEHGGVDIVVHNAGVTRDKTLRNMDRERWDLCVDINLSAVVRITDALVAGPLMDDGRIICLSSIAGLAGNFGQTNYAASKAGITEFVRSLASSMSKRGVTVNAIAPGFIETRLTDAIPPVQREVARRLCALGQGGVPQDIAELVSFLASPGGAGVTGDTHRVCGGNWVGR